MTRDVQILIKQHDLWGLCKYWVEVRYGVQYKSEFAMTLWGAKLKAKRYAKQLVKLNQREAIKYTIPVH